MSFLHIKFVFPPSELDALNIKGPFIIRDGKNQKKTIKQLEQKFLYVIEEKTKSVSAITFAV